MTPIEQDLREAFFPTLFRGVGADNILRSIQDHSVKRDGLGIPNPKILAARHHSMSEERFEDLVAYLM